MTPQDIAVDYLLDNFVVEPKRGRIRALLQTEKGIRKLRSGLCHFQRHLLVELGREPLARGWVAEVTERLGPGVQILVIGQRHFGVMTLEEARSGVGICSFAIDLERRFAVYVGDCGDDLIFGLDAADGRRGHRQP